MTLQIRYLIRFYPNKNIKQRISQISTSNDHPPTLLTQTWKTGKVTIPLQHVLCGLVRLMRTRAHDVVESNLQMTLVLLKKAL